MKDSSLENIASVFASRHDTAMAALKSAQRALALASQQLKQAQQEFKEYREYRLRREAELYAAFMAQCASTRELELVKGKVGNLLAGDAAFEQRISACERSLEQAEHALNQARIIFTKISSKVENWSDYVRETRSKEALMQEIRDEDNLEPISQKHL